MNVALGLEFHDDLPIDQQIGSEAAVQFHVVVNHRDWLLLLHLETALAKFIGEAGSVSGFKESGAEAFVNLDRGSDDGLSEFLGFHVEAPERKA